ncbi:MAG: sigma-54-dependent Fis family transcriptional regulator [Spartobacteria bacterium]|nr:sigma-54-dependent Fis family transcriptional regulator [Spartobacteria bacterium]
MHVLIVEDDQHLMEGLLRILRRSGWTFLTAANGRDGLAQVEQADVMITDIKMPEMDGMELLRQARKLRPELEVIVMTAFGTIPSAVEAMKLGARAYLTKPFKTDELLLHLRNIEEIIQLRSVASRAGRGDLVGSSAAMRRVYAEIDIGAASDAPVLITGETGSGKDLAAHAVHDLSSRRNEPFVAVNLGAIPHELAEDELFGHEKGAFTGAHSRKKGRFAIAEGGTLFLDEINSLPLSLQPKLLRAIESREIWLLGSEQKHQSNVRIIAATNADIEKLVGKGRFREDLYYRLNVLRIAMPPLSEHIQDIPQIAQVILSRICERTNGPACELAPEVFSFLMSQSWPGNIREMANCLERAYAAAMNAPGAMPFRIEAVHIANMPAQQEDVPFKEAKARAMDEWSKATIRHTLTQCGGNVSAAARKLQMSRTALIRLINKYALRDD